MTMVLELIAECLPLIFAIKSLLPFLISPLPPLASSRFSDVHRRVSADAAPLSLRYDPAVLRSARKLAGPSRKLCGTGAVPGSSLYHR